MTQNVYCINWYNFTSPVHQWVPLHPSTVPVFYVWKNLWKDMVKARFLCVTAITWTLVEALWLSQYFYIIVTPIQDLSREEGTVDNLLFEQFSPKTARKWRPFPARPLNIPLGLGLETPPHHRGHIWCCNENCLIMCDIPNILEIQHTEIIAVRLL